MNEIVTEKNYPVQRLWVCKSILGSLLNLIILIPFYLFSKLSFGKSENTEVSIVIFIIIIVLIIYVISHFVITILRRTTFHYSIEEQYLTLKQGILSKQQRHIPYEVIQHLFVKQDLFDRIFGLASLEIENASQGSGILTAPSKQKFFRMRRSSNQRQKEIEMIGSLGNKVIIPGLTKQNAEILKEIFLQKMKKNPIEDNQSGL